MRTQMRLLAIVTTTVLTMTLVAFGSVGSASADLAVPLAQDVGLTCSDGTDIGMPLDPTGLTELTDAVSAIAATPAGDPPLTCNVNSSSEGGGPKDFAVGGGDILGLCSFFGGTGPLRQHFALSAHADGETMTSGVGGTFNISMEATADCPVFGTLVAKVDCLLVEGNHADMTAVITKSSGNFFTPDFFSPGTEIWIAATDSDNPALPDTIQASLTPEPNTRCSFFPRDFENPVVKGSINVRDAD